MARITETEHEETEDGSENGEAITTPEEAHTEEDTGEDTAPVEETPAGDTDDESLIECQGSFQRLPASEFELDPAKKYSDLYIWGKGVWASSFGGILDSEGIPLRDAEGNYQRESKG